MVRNALLQHPNTAVRSLQDLEITILSIRLVLGEPLPSGSADPDGVGVVQSQVALYVGGATACAALEFILYIQNGGLEW